MEEFSKLSGEGGGKLRTSIGDDFVEESKMEEDFVEEERGNPLAVMNSLVGQRITPLVSPWSTMTRRESKPKDRKRSVMRSQEIFWNGREASNLIGDNGGTVGCVLALFCWHLAQPSMYRQTKEARPSHQNSAATSWWVFRKPGWPADS